MLDVHNDSAPSNIMKLFTRTSNIHTYATCLSTSQLFSVKHSRLKMQKKAFLGLMSKSGMRCLMNTKTHQKNPSKKKQKELFSIFQEPNEIIPKFKHSKIESNWSSSTTFFIRLGTLGFFLLYNEHLPFSFFSFFVYLFVLLCYICSLLFHLQCN